MAEVIGVLFLLILFVTFLFSLIAYSRIHSKWWLARRMYQHVDDCCGAKRFEAEYAVTQRHFWGPDKDWVRWMWPHPELSGTMVRPHWWRRRQYVQLGYANKPWPQPYFKKDISLITIMWTSETGVNRSPAWFTILEQQVAQALSLPWTEDVFTHNRKEFPHANGLEDHRPERDQVTLVLADPMSLPARVSATDALNGRLEKDAPGEVD